MEGRAIDWEGRGRGDEGESIGKRRGEEGKEEASSNQTRFKIDRIIICPDQARRVRPQRVLLPPVFRRVLFTASHALLSLSPSPSRSRSRSLSSRLGEMEMRARRRGFGKRGRPSSAETMANCSRKLPRRIISDRRPRPFII